MNDRVTAVEQQLSVTLPEAIAAIYATADGRFNDKGQWWVIWPLGRLVDENQSAWSMGLPRNFIAFGDDGTGNPFLVDLVNNSSEVLRWSWIDLDVERSEGSVAEFLAEWCDESGA